MLQVHDLSVGYGRAIAVRGVSLEVGTGAIVAVIGANGAGKTTLMRGLMGQLRPVAGSVLLDGHEISGYRPYRLVHMGMTVVPQDRGTLAPLSVQENLELAARRLDRSERQRSIEEVYEAFPVLRERRSIRAGLLSGGEQQMLAFGRAIVTRPRVLLMDEPSTGLSPLMTTSIMKAIKDLRDERKISILVVEQNVTAVLSIADDVYVLDRGMITRHDSPERLRDDDQVRAAFLGI